MLSMDEILDVISSPMRRRILELLSSSGGPVSYTNIWGIFDLTSTGSLNHHLQILSERELIVRQKSGYVLTPRGKTVFAMSRDLEDSFRKHVMGEKHPGDEPLDRKISIKPFEKGDLFGLLLKAGTISSKGPLNEERVRKEIEENKQKWIKMEARGIHGRKVSSVLNLLAIEEDHVVGGIVGEEQRIEEVGIRDITVRSIFSFGDPIVSRKILSGLLDYARRRGARNIFFELDDPDDLDEAVLVELGAKLRYEARHRGFVLQTQ